MGTVAVAAYSAKLFIGGAPAVVSAASTTNTSGNTYQVDTAAKRLIDPATARTWKDGGTPIAASGIASEDLLFGTVTLVSPPGGAVTLDGKYIPIAAIADVKASDLTETNDSVDTTTIANASGVKMRTQTLIDAAVTAKLLNDLTVDLDPITGGAQTFRTIIAARTPLLMQIDPDGGNTHVFRSWMVPGPGKTAFDPAAVVTSDISFKTADQGNALSAAGAGWGVP